MDNTKTTATYFVSQNTVNIIVKMASKFGCTESEALDMMIGELVKRLTSEASPPTQLAQSEAGETDETTNLEQRLAWTEKQLLALHELAELDGVREKLRLLEKWLDALVKKLETARL